jgi:uncharacterized protein (DUF3084 family)
LIIIHFFFASFSSSFFLGDIRTDIFERDSIIKTLQSKKQSSERCSQELMNHLNIDNETIRQQMKEILNEKENIDQILKCKNEELYALKQELEEKNQQIMLLKISIPVSPSTQSAVAVSTSTSNICSKSTFSSCE